MYFNTKVDQSQNFLSFFCLSDPQQQELMKWLVKQTKVNIIYIETHITIL